jgi:DNA-binding NarL/FixJ family response regulator
MPLRLKPRFQSPTGYAPPLSLSDILSNLTEREQEVLTLIAEGLTNKQIGEQLGISPKTVARHRDNITQKLNRSSRAELTRYAIQKGLINP